MRTVMFSTLDAFRAWRQQRQREYHRLYMREWRLARRRQPLPGWRSKAAIKGWSRRYWHRLRQQTVEYDAWLDFKARSDARAAAWREKHKRARRTGRHQ
jgi:hypothetical protein